MSVAFRRDVDEEHLEPRFELPIPPGPNTVTPRGYALIAARSAELEAALAGELGEDERKAVLRDARYWRSRLTSAQVAPAPSGATVAIGTRVTIDREGQSRTFEIVGHDESDPASDRIAFSSPLARALIGAEVGQDCEFPNSDQPITIVAIAIS
jgi:transcription elongation GreA/GreB family factor